MKRPHRWLIVLSLLLATGLRAWNLDVQSVWFDEGFSWHAAMQPNPIAALNGDPTNPPLYYLLLHIWVRLIGDSEFALRAFSLLQGILLLALIGAAARRWFGAGAAVLATALGTFLPLLWWASQEARMYNTLALVVLIAALGLVCLLDGGAPPRRAWIALLGGELAALYTHNTGVVVLAAVNAVFLIAWMLEAVHRRVCGNLLRRWIGGQVIVVVLWLPELLARFAQVGSANITTATPPELSPTLLWQSWQALWASSWEMVRAGDDGLAKATLALLPTVIPALLILRMQRGRLVVGFATALYAALLGALTALGVGMHGRYLVMIAPLVVIALAGGVAGSSQQSAPSSQYSVVRRRDWQRISRMFGVFLVSGAALAWFWLPGRPDPAYQHDQAREMVAYYAQELGADDIVLAWSYAERYDLLYYWDRLGATARLVTLPEGAEEAQIITLVNDALGEAFPARVELNTWFTQRADSRGMLPCLLEHGQPAPAHVFSVYGMISTRYTPDGPLSRPAMQAATTVNFGPLRLDVSGVPLEPLRADAGICLPLNFTLTAPVHEDLRVAVNALNTFGWEFTGDDAMILTAAQVPTSQLEPGQMSRAYILLRLPPGTPPGNYPLRLRIYSAANPVGLDVRDLVSGAPIGKDAPLGTVSVLAGMWQRPALEGTLDIAPGLTLTNAADLAPGGLLAPGDTLRLTLRWWVENEYPEVTVALVGDGWQVANAAQSSEYGLALDWREMIVPPDARGPAALIVWANSGAPVTLAEYTIAAPEHRMTAPDVQRQLEIDFPGVGTLYGFTLAGESIRGGESFDVTLVWQAAGTTDIPYVVTVQLLSQEDILLAQHDSAPSNGERPTTGWIAGEYIVDPHRLIFRDEARDYSGPARLIAAFYNPTSGARVTTAGGENHAELIDQITVNPPG